MKHFFALAVSILMLATLSTGAFATTYEADYEFTDICDIGFLLDDDDNKVDLDEDADDSVPYGETIYYPLLSDSGSGDYVAVYESDAVKKAKIKTDWDDGSSYIKELSVVKKKYTGVSVGSTKTFGSYTVSFPNKYAYFLSITTKQRSKTTTNTDDVSGTVTIKRTSGDPEFDIDVDIDFEVGYKAPEDNEVIPKVPALFEPDENFDEDDETTFEFEADDDSYFVVNTNNQKKLVLGMDCDYDDSIGEKYPNADLYFFNGNGAKFNKIGYLYLYCDDRSSYVYAIDDKENLSSVKTTYDSYEDCVVVRTRTLGRYVVSNTKLDIADVVDNDDKAVIFDNDTQTNRNPGTGGWGYDDIAYYGWGDDNTAVASSAAPAAAPAVVAQQPASSAPAESKAENSKPEATEVAVKKPSTDVTKAAPEVTLSIGGSSNGGLDTRVMLMIACSVGAVASAIGLLICAFASFGKSRR